MKQIQSLIFLPVIFILGSSYAAQNGVNKTNGTPWMQVVISQVYGGGGNSSAPYKNDFIELVNRGGTSVDITGWTVQYASATGTSWQSTSLSGTIAPYRYYLIKEASGTSCGGPCGADLPTPDATGTIAMNSSQGKVALVKNSTLLTGTCPWGSDTNIVDFVGYGSAANCYEGPGPAPAPSNTTSAQRAGNGAQDNDANSTDFSSAAPNPRNSSSSPLPVEIASLSAQISTNGKSILLEWITISEINNYGFYVERRTAGESLFIEIPNSFIPGAGTTLETQHYSFTDNTISTPGIYDYRLKQVDLDGLINNSMIVTVAISALSVKDETPIEYHLFQNHPNPFNPATRINFELSKASFVTLKVFDILGKEVATLVNEKREAGKHEVEFRGVELTSGVYFYILTTEEFREVKKMAIQK